MLLSTKVQSAITDLGKVDILIEMVIGHLVRNSEDVKDRKWFTKIENALYLMEETYKEKKSNLIVALEGGEDDA